MEGAKIISLEWYTPNPGQFTVESIEIRSSNGNSLQSELPLSGDSGCEHSHGYF